MSALAHLFDRASTRQRILLAWIATGATIQLCLPALHGGSGAMGALALWMWWLPLAGLGLDLLLFSGVDSESGTVTRQRRRSRRTAAARPQSPRAAGVAAVGTARATRPPRGLSVTSYSTPSRIGR